MPLYKVDITIPFTFEAAGKKNIHEAVDKIRWKMIFNQLRALGFIPAEMKFREELFRRVKVTHIKETAYS